jgi:murein DD-endopeptidase MepM/ murein hydrolase activator NlpD
MATTEETQAAATPTKLFFPIPFAPSESYKTRPRNFGAYRTSTRKHAGIDLYAPYLTQIRAISDGIVIQPAYSFYDGTNALEVTHPGIGVVRYGEISSAKVIKFKAGEKVTAGQLIAYVGKLDTLNRAMLHFELYSGKSSGALTVRSNLPYQRRKDLLNPTDLMDKLYKASFG